MTVPVFLTRGAVGIGVLSYACGVFHMCGCHPVKGSSAPYCCDNQKQPPRFPKGPLGGTAP